MRVLAITPWFPTRAHPVSGVFTLRDAELLARSHQVTVLHLCRPDWMDSAPAATSEINVVRVPFSITNPTTFPRAMRAVSQHLRRADLLHTMALPALLLSRLVRPKLPWVHTEHFSDLVTPPAGMVAKVIRKSLMRAFAAPDESVAVGRALAAAIDSHRVRVSTVIPNMVRFPQQAQEIRAQVANQTIRLVAVGGLVERKGPLLAVETVAELQKLGREATLTWVGEGPLLEAAQKRARELGVLARCAWTGALEPEDVSARLCEADLFLLPVETETFGVAMAEALAHGLPVVATGTGGHEEFLPGSASRRIATREAESLARAVVDLLDDPDRWSSDQITEYAATLFSEGKRELAYAEVYLRAQEQHPGSAA